MFLLCTVPGITHNLSEHYSCSIAKCPSWPQPTLPLPPPALLTQVALVLWLQITDFQGQFSALMKHSCCIPARRASLGNSPRVHHSNHQGLLQETVVTVRVNWRVFNDLPLNHKGPLMAKTCSFCQAWRTAVGNCLWNETDTVAERRKSDRSFRWKESTTDQAITWQGRRRKNRGTLLACSYRSCS